MNNNNNNNNNVVTQSIVPCKSAIVHTEEVNDFAAVYKITAPELPEDVVKRQPIDVITVVDRSGSMAQHMPMLREALKFVVSQLQDGDNLSIVSFHSVVTTNLPLTRIDGFNSKERINAIIDTLRDEGCTNLSGGLFSGLHQLQGVRKNPMATVLLLTDGLANEGIVDTNQITRRMRSRDFIRSYEGERTSFSDREQLMDELAVPNCSVNTFGFGQNHNASMLQSIAETGRGLYNYLKAADDIGAAFAGALGGVMHTIARCVEVEFEHGVTAKVTKVSTKYTITPTPNGFRVQIPDLMACESRDIIVFLTVRATPEPLAIEPVCNIQLRYHHVQQDREIRADPCILALYRPSAADMQPHMAIMNTAVDAQLNRIKAVEAMDTAAKFGDDGRVQEARDVIDAVVNALRESVSRDDPVVQQLLRDLSTVREGLLDVRSYASSGSKMMKAMFHGHAKQRANVQCSAAYSVPAQRKAVSSWFSRK